MLWLLTTLLVGGVLGDSVGIRSPFMTSVGFFVINSIYSPFCMPWSSPVADSCRVNKQHSDGFFAPVRVLAPRQITLHSGRITQYYGLTLLALGIFFAVVRKPTETLASQNCLSLTVAVFVSSWQQAMPRFYSSYMQRPISTLAPLRTVCSCPETLVFMEYSFCLSFQGLS